MQINIKSYGDDGYVNYKQPLSEYIEEKMVPDTEGNSKIENIDAHIGNLSRSFGILVDILAEKKVLGEYEVKQIVQEFTHEISLL